MFRAAAVNQAPSPPPPSAADLAAWAGRPLPLAAAGPQRPRTVDRIETPYGALARKRYLGRHARRQLEREWKRLTALHAALVPVPPPVGCTQASAVPTLFARWIEGGRELDQAWDQAAGDPGARRRLARAVGAALGALHRAGFAHGDLHARNLVVDAADRCWLLDVSAARPAPERARAADWHPLAGHFAWRARPVDRLRALVASGELPIDRSTRRAALRRLALRAERARQRFLRHHERRCDGRGRAFVALAWGGIRGVAARAEGEGLIEPLRQLLGEGALARLPERLAAIGARRVHASAAGDTQLWRLEVATAGGERRTLALKWFDDRGALRRVLRGSRARRAWRNAFRLQMAAVATPAPLLFLEGRAGARRPASVLVRAFRDEARMLHHHVAAVGVAAAHGVLRAVAECIARLHDEGLSHRDLKAENLLVTAAGQVELVDLDGLARRRIDLERVARDLTRLNASFRDVGAAMMRARLAVLAAYRAARRRERPPWRPLLRRIASLTGIKWQTAPRSAGCSVDRSRGAAGSPRSSRPR